MYCWHGAEMKIRRRKSDQRNDAEIRADLARVSCKPEIQGRLCGPDCMTVCPTCSSTVCDCNCSSQCPDIPDRLTSDPSFPIEGGIAPLVFEIARLGVFEPCWSCEGHNDPSGNLWKIPRVWFYCDSVVQVRLLSDVLKSLEIDKLTRAPWQVCLTFSDEDNPATTFSLEPVIGPGARFTLEDLQGDTRVLTEFLHSMMIESADQLAARAGL